MRKLFLLVAVSSLIMSCGSLKRAAYNDASAKLEQQYSLYKNTKYKYGGTTASGFDCSGFVMTVYKNAFNVQLPRATEAMMKEGHKVSRHKLKPGDLVFFRPSRKYDHVGIYLGKNQFMHSSTSQGVIKSKLDNPYWKKKYRFAKRILNF